MKMKSAIAALLLACTVLPLRAGEAAPSAAQIEMKMKQIELEVALKQYEKILTMLVEARIEMELLGARGDLSEAQLKEKAGLAEKTKRLEDIKARLREEVQVKGKELEEMRKTETVESKL